MIQTKYRSICALALVLVLSQSPAGAEPTVDSETIIVIDRTPDPDAAPAARDRDRALGDAPFVTIVHPDEHPATASVADAVGETAGVQTRSLGGLGAYQSITVRGAAAGHTEVLIDGVPLARIAAVTTDLGRFPLDAFGEVELYRGAVPVELGGAGVGGALNLVTRLGPGEHGERWQASLGGGSFGARHLRLHYGDDHGSVVSSTTLGYQGAAGDFTYFNNGGTLLNPTDDSYQVRRNNGFDQIDGATRISAVDRGAVGGVRVSAKRQGLPGSTSEPSLSASLDTLDVVGDGRIDHDVGSATTRELAYVLVEDQHLHDPSGELGLGTQERGYVTISGGATSTWSEQFGEHRGTAGVELRADRFRDRDLAGAQPILVGNRLGGAVLADADLVLAKQLVITPAVRLDIVRTAPTPANGGALSTAEAPRWDIVPSPRVTARVQLTDDVTLKGSGGWYVRLPTLTEVFGDRGYILGSPDLRPERGPSCDFGGVWAPAHALAGGEIDRVLIEADMFATRARDTIALVTFAGYVARAENIGRSQTYGAELVGSARVAHIVSLTASFTQLATEQLSEEVSYYGKALPRSPGQLLYTRADVVQQIFRRRASAWLDASYQADSFLDPANLGRVPSRVLLGTGARIEIASRLGIAIAIANLADVRIVQLPLDPPPSPTFTSTPTALADVAGFPLPGRSFYLSMDWSH